MNSARGTIVDELAHDGLLFLVDLFIIFIYFSPKNPLKVYELATCLN